METIIIISMLIIQVLQLAVFIRASKRWKKEKEEFINDIKDLEEVIECQILEIDEEEKFKNEKNKVLYNENEMNKIALNHKEEEIERLKKQHIEDLHNQRLETLDSIYNDVNEEGKIRAKLVDEIKVYGGLTKVSKETGLSYFCVRDNAHNKTPMNKRTIEKLKKYYNL